MSATPGVAKGLSGRRVCARRRCADVSVHVEAAGDAERREGLAAGSCKATGGAQPRGGAHVAMARGAIASTQLTLCSLRHRREAQFPTATPRADGTLPPDPRADPTGSGFRPAPGVALPPLSAVARVLG